MKIKIAFFLVFIFGAACSSKDVNPGAKTPLFEVPSNFPAPTYDFKSNPETQAGFELGRALFSDGILSRDGSISCAECHNQSYAFTHHGHDLSHGIDNQAGFRNATPIQNTAFYKEFFWDGGVSDLDLFSIAPIQNPVEMDDELPNVLEKLRKSSIYPAMFQKAYGSNEITSAKFLKALSQFMNALVSANSRYDKYVRKEAGGTLTSVELEGKTLFEKKCANCHSGDLFTNQEYRNNGLPIYNAEDTGRYRISQNDNDKYKFKVPSLRNIEVTAPYMHDGRFYSLEAVLDHYTDGMVDFPNLPDDFTKNEKLGLTISSEEKTKIIAFLKTLTDHEFLTNSKFSAK